MSTIFLTHHVSKEGISDNLMCEVKLLEMTKYDIFTCFSIKYQTLRSEERRVGKECVR